MFFNFLGINWLNLDETILEIYENYFILFTSPKFNFPPEGEYEFTNSKLGDFLGKKVFKNEVASKIEVSEKELLKYS